VIIQAVLVVALLVCTAYGLLHTGRSRLVRWTLVLASLLGIYFVLQPDVTNRIAARLGVGRGADLVLYCWVVISLALFARLQFALLKAHEQITELARQLAVATAREPPADAASGFVAHAADTVESRCDRAPSAPAREGPRLRPFASSAER
jgi:hypothetical protein